MRARVQDGSEGWKEGDHVAWGQCGTERLKVSLLHVSSTTEVMGDGNEKWSKIYLHIVSCLRKPHLLADKLLLIKDGFGTGVRL